ncbi:MAG: gfo/Idh/MocA family oxidoreductase, partial [Candidatus Omnitrophica bacterium]|nr:gfo/Idh/MocA family oxidoreductase [Candidatus Omnitrophota bacterium]
RERNVEIFNDYIEMLERFYEKLDFITIPAPIHLHAEMHAACVKRQIPVYLEKPPTLDYLQLLEMIKLDSCAVKKTNVGFNFIIQDLRQKIKQRILDGDFGKIEKIEFFGMWPRPVSYFRRSPWAGRLILDGKFVLDSCFGNAVSHYVQNILFWCGKDGIFSYDPIETAHAELYRANDIQGADTVFVVASTKNVPELRIAITHACNEKTRDIEKIFCQKAVISFEGYAPANNGTEARCEINWKNGEKELITEPNEDLLLKNFLHYSEYISGKRDQPLITLLHTEPFVMLNGLIYISSKKIHPIQKDFIEITENEKGETFFAIKGIKEISQKFIETGLLPSQQGISWGERTSAANKDEIGKLRQTIKAML